jgi:signal transduction histidine kinase
MRGLGRVLGTVRFLIRRAISLVGPKTVWVLTTAISAAALALYVLHVRFLDPVDSPFAIPWPVIAVAFFLAEDYVIRFDLRRDVHSYSLTELPLVVGLFFLPPSELLLAQLVGDLVTLTWRRQPPVKLFFNVGNLALNGLVAITVFHALGGGAGPLRPAGAGAAFAAALSTAALGPVLINLAIRLSGGGLPPGAWRDTLGIAGLVAGVNASLGIAASMVTWLDWRVLWVLLLPTAALLLGVRLYGADRRKHRGLEFLYSTSRVLHRSLQVERAVPAVLSQARDMFQAELAEITLLPRAPNEKASRSSLGRSKAETMVSLDELPTGPWAKALAAGCPMIAPADDSGKTDSGRPRAAMFAPLISKDSVIGMMQIADPIGEHNRFEEEDLQLFTTLVNHASVALENAALVDQLEESLDHLKELNELKDDFVASVSHELRTPLTSIQGYVQMLVRHGEKLQGDRQAAFLTEVGRQTDRLRYLIEDLLAVSRIEARQERIVLEPFSAESLVREILSELKDWGDHQLEIDFESEMDPVEADENKVRHILMNLIENALKYAPANTRITIRGRVEESREIISVEDQGPGIPEHLRSKIFDRFYQVDQSLTREQGGMGLGLYISQKMAEAMGGEVRLERSDERGSVFSLLLPLSPTAGITEDSQGQVEAPDRASSEPSQALPTSRGSVAV